MNQDEGTFHQLQRVRAVVYLLDSERGETRMKKKNSKNQEQLRRLRLNRETIRPLSDPALLGLARGGTTDSCVNQNCVPTGCSGCTG